MLRTTLSAITAMVITMSSLSADRGISYDGTGTKDMQVVQKVEVSENSYIEQDNGGVYGEPYSEEKIYSEPNPTFKPTPAPYSENEVVDPTPSYDNTIIYAKSAKKFFRVGEAIKLRLKLKNKSSLYVWTVGRDGRGYMILPNKFTGYNSFRKNYAYVFPEPSLNYKFQSDQAGTEHVYILATSKPISRAKMEAIFNKKVGNYPVASAKDTKDFTTKDIHVIAKQEHLEYDIAHVAVQVVDGQKRANRKPVQREQHRSSGVTININNN